MQVRVRRRRAAATEKRTWTSLPAESSDEHLPAIINIAVIHGRAHELSSDRQEPRTVRRTYPGSLDASTGLLASSWVWFSMGSGAGGAGLAGLRAYTTTTYSRTRRGRLPESLGCTTDYRHETGAARRTPPRSERRPPPAPSRASAASIHSLRTQLFIGRARRRRLCHVSARHVGTRRPAPAARRAAAASEHAHRTHSARPQRPPPPPVSTHRLQRRQPTNNNNKPILIFIKNLSFWKLINA